MACPLATERVWIEKSRYHEAERNYFERLSKLLKGDSDKEFHNAVGGHDEVDDALPIQPKPGAAHQKKKVISDNKEFVTISNGTKDAPVVKYKKEKNKKNKQINNVYVGAKDGEEKVDQEKEVVKKVEDPAEKSYIEESTKSEDVKPKKIKKKKKNHNKDEISPENLKHDTAKGQSDAKVSPKCENNQAIIFSERQKVEKHKVGSSGQQCTLVSEIAKARQHIKNSLERMDGIAALAATPAGDALERLNHVEKDNENLRKLVDHLQKSISDIQIRMKNLEDHVKSVATTAPAPKEKPAENKKNECEDDDGVDLFASDSEEEDATAAKLREQRLAEYNAKKSKKPALIAKSSVILDVKPWDDETDLNQMESAIRKIETDGLLWGAAKFVPVAFGIQKLSISCVVEDEKVSIDWLTEEIEKLDSFVQSVDVAAFNKI